MNAKQEDRARDDRDESDRFMKSADDLKSLGRSDGDVARTVRFKPKSGRVDSS
jgi:hypothetical protein